MTKAASKGPKASVQYVRTLAKRVDRANARCRNERAELAALFELVYQLLSVLDPEIVDVLPTSRQLRITSYANLEEE